MLSKRPILSQFSALSLANNVTAVSQHAPNEYEWMTYYHSIAYYIFNTPLNGVWLTIGPQICNLIQAYKVQWTSINPVCFFTHIALRQEVLGDKVKGTLGPIVIWVRVRPDSTLPKTTHKVSQEILALLQKNGVEDVVVE